MRHPHEIHTQRLLLRQWRPSNFPAFARMGADAEVMRFFPHPLREHCLYRIAAQ